MTDWQDVTAVDEARRRAHRRFGLGLAAALVAVVLAVAAAIGNRTGDWQVTLLGEARVVVDGDDAPGGRAATAGALARGGRIRTPEGTAVAVIHPGVLALEVAPATELGLSAPVGRWFARETAASLAAGEVLAHAGPGFGGAELEILTPEGRVRMTGGTLAVRRDSLLTRVCVHMGACTAGPHGGTLVTVPAGECLVLHGERAAPDRVPLDEARARRLGRFAARAAGWLAGDAPAGQR